MDLYAKHEDCMQFLFVVHGRTNSYTLISIVPMAIKDAHLDI